MDQQKQTERLKAELWCAVDKQVKELVPSLNVKGNITYSPKFINALMSLTYLQLTDIGTDLELFANHAGRGTITRDDLMLLLRKTPLLQEMVSNLNMNSLEQ
ncbi:Mhf1p NDAI_0B02770 [Naumovozyma dairenensis CBS 421]|uniref:MHF histone-fold complex subunit 1 n=1 Tax=Naumovozyma dairenensis (strain ATCC 10597 / BCRC 20456 / CBS 421 / NBRC 0211 / NRRL Y-12639) TaxID=1071378 RepID=G0W6A1_NAUDC|nr:hypothetical protein NDAI_0B02770 [Naumovozyma dairenensis CBS 421]CCD23312.1 hypothetical protein NDAI_0B02770 [Naumovozyma dairenensis CBS 421]